MKKKSVIIAVCNQKGGVGKTTYTTIITSILHYHYGKRCLCVDTDFPQWSIDLLRQRDLDILNRSDFYKLLMIRQFRECGQRIWPIVKSSPSGAPRDIDNIIESSPDAYDIIITDLPGTLNTEGIIKMLSGVDYVFVPMKADKIVIESSVMFARGINSSLVEPGKYRTKGVYLFWTMIDRREKNPLYEEYRDAITGSGLHILDSMVPYRSKFSREITPEGGSVGRSTLFPPDKAFCREAQLYALCEEILAITGLNQ